MDWRFYMDTPGGRIAHLQCELGECVAEAGRVQRWGGGRKWPEKAGPEVPNNFERLLKELWDVEAVGNAVLIDLQRQISPERVAELRRAWEATAYPPNEELTPEERMAEALGIDARERRATAASADASPCGACNGSGTIADRVINTNCGQCGGAGFIKDVVYA